MSERIYNVLFLCTGNTARSVLAEGILRKDGEGRFRAFSAGSQPKGSVNPFALKTLAHMAILSMHFARKAGMNLLCPQRRRWILFLPCVIARQVRPVPIGRANRHRRIGALKILLRLRGLTG